LLNI
jgi:centrosomal protein CEP120